MPVPAEPEPVCVQAGRLLQKKMGELRQRGDEWLSGRDFAVMVDIFLKDPDVSKMYVALADGNDDTEADTRQWVLRLITQSSL